MDRRSLLSFFGSIPAFSFLRKPENSSKPDDIEHFSPKTESYRGYKIIWTGWKADQASPYFMAQYVAQHPTQNGSMLYVCNPGGWGCAFKGQVFDVGWRWPQLLTDGQCSPQDLIQVQKEMREAIVFLVDFAISIGWSGISSFEPPQKYLRYTGWKDLTVQQQTDWNQELIKEMRLKD